MLYSFVHKSNLQPKLHRVIGQLPSPPCCTSVPFLAVFSACLRMRGFAFLLGVIISTKQYSERQPPPRLYLDSADLSGCTGSRSAMCEWPNAGLPVWEYWLPKVKSLESQAMQERLLHLHLSRSTRLGSLLFVSLLDIHLSPQLAVNVLSDIPPNLCKLLLS